MILYQRRSLLKHKFCIVFRGDKMSNQKIVNYILDNYSSYIDNLDLYGLMDEISEDENIKYFPTLPTVICTIVQLVVDELGGDVVNDILNNTSPRSIYASVHFRDNVVVTKDTISEYEFFGAVFEDGITIKSNMLPKSALEETKMFGIVDLSAVSILEDGNLLYKTSSNCTVKLSKDLKYISPSALRFRSGTTVEFPGTYEEFSNLIESFNKRWTPYARGSFKSAIGRNSIKCSDKEWSLV